MKTQLLKKLLKKSKEAFNVTCSSCSNCNGRECGGVDVKLRLTHNEYRELFGEDVHSKLLTVGNLPMDRKSAIRKVIADSQS